MASWSGYQSGVDRNDLEVDALAELRNPSGVSATRYNALLITEQHGLLGSLMWHDTVRCLRHYHDQFIATNPQGLTFFFEPWLDIERKSDPRSWIAYERAASPVWGRIVGRINLSLELEGRADRIVSIPAGLALAELVAAATTGAGLPQVTRGSVRDTVDALVHDDVHATDAASFFVAAVTYAAIFKRCPQAAGVTILPTDLGDALARFAWDFMVRQQERSELQRLVKFNAQYWEYVYRTTYRRDLGRVRGRIRWLKHRVQARWLLGRQDTRNPLYFSAAEDPSFWAAGS